MTSFACSQYYFSVDMGLLGKVLHTEQFRAAKLHLAIADQIAANRVVCTARGRGEFSILPSPKWDFIELNVKKTHYVYSKRSANSNKGFQLSDFEFKCGILTPNVLLPPFQCVCLRRVRLCGPT